MAAVFLGISFCSLTRGATRPNVLWICADDHAAYVFGADGNRQVRTPRLDQLAAEGTRFSHAYCNAPVCTASRQSFLTGRYPHRVGVTVLKTPLSESAVTLPEMLREAGYRTCGIGKMHFNSALAHGFEKRIDMPEYGRWLAMQEREPLPTDVELLPQWKPFHDPARVWLNSFCRPYAAHEADMAGTFFADTAARELAESDARSNKPFFLMVSFYEPHSPFHFPVEFRDRIDPTQMPVYKAAPEDDAQIPAIFRDLTTSEKQGIAAAYYTSVEFLDKNVGRVLDALSAAGHGDDTLVIYTGDHGYMLGQHGRFEKHCSFEPAIRVPLVMRLPARVPAGAVSPALVELIDVVPTVLDLCGIDKPTTVEGRSLAGVLDGTNEQHRDCVFVEYAENEEAAIRTVRWKLVYSTGRRERQDGYTSGRPLPGKTVRLFDVQNDPDELVNLAALPEQASRVAELTDKLAQHMRDVTPGARELASNADADAILARCLPPVEEMRTSAAPPRSDKNN
ncbi:MAG TPA: sulfatase [Pirellulales bacterium]|jgi:choline-sulfatase